LGKYYSAVTEPDADADSKPNAVRLAFRFSGDSRPVPDFYVRLSDGVAESVSLAVSKAFTRDENEGPDIPDVLPTLSPLAPGAKNYITPEGAQKLRDELQRLVEVTRPQLVDTRDDPDSKRQLARVDQRISQLEESLHAAEIVEAPNGPADVVRFGAFVTVGESDGSETRYRIVGVDETDLDNNWVSWMSPIAKALLNRKKGERPRFKFPSGEETLEIKEISYE
jgi:transcription elongation factor GreB